MKIHGFDDQTEALSELSVYGADAVEIKKLIEADAALAEKFHEKLPYTVAEVVWTVRNEMACTLEDVLARRLRALFLDAKTALEIAPKVVGIMAKELNKDELWQKTQIAEFGETAKSYIIERK